MSETLAAERAYGAQSMWAPLRRVLVRAPDPASVAAWQAYGWRGEPDPVRLADEHEAFRALLADAGADVLVGETPAGVSPDTIYVYDPALVTNDGAIMLRPGKEGRRIEVETMAADLVAAGVPIAGRLEAPAQVEGGDTIWLDERTLLAGIGYRTNEAGVEALRAALPDAEAVAISGAGHLAMMERHVVFNDVLNRYLERVLAPERSPAAATR